MSEWVYCEFCKHWEEPDRVWNAHNNLGSCNVAQGEHEEFEVEDYAGYGAYLKTRADFACNQAERKEDAE